MKKFKVSIIGYGYWGPKLARNFQNSNFFNLTSIIDISKQNIIKAKRDFPLAKIGSDYKHSLNKLNISKALSMDWLAPCARVGKNPLKASPI